MDPMGRWGVRLFAPNPRTWTLAEERDLFKRVRGSRGTRASHGLLLGMESCWSSTRASMICKMMDIQIHILPAVHEYIYIYTHIYIYICKYLFIPSLKETHANSMGFFVAK